MKEKKVKKFVNISETGYFFPRGWVVCIADYDGSSTPLFFNEYKGAEKMAKVLRKELKFSQVTS